MHTKQDDLWQGGEWERPTPIVPSLIPDPPAQKKKKKLRRPVLVFTGLLTLICTLTTVMLLSRYQPFQPPAQGSDLTPSPTASSLPKLPIAPTGTGITLPISPVTGDSLPYSKVYEKNQHSIVTIYAATQKSIRYGTGIVMSADGYIITNAHIIQDAHSIVVIFGENTIYNAALVGLCAEEDLAVLKIDARGLTPAEFGDSFSVQVGDEVSALGNPMGYRMTMTAGIISAVDRRMEVDGQTMYLLQTSAAINSGSSGGALLNDRGQVIGVTILKIMSNNSFTEGLSFAIPTERVKYVVDHLIAGSEIRVPYLGITVHPSPDRQGLLVTQVQPDSDAAARGIRQGDIILSANGKPVQTNRALQRVKELCRIGDTLTLELLRESTQLECAVLLRDYDSLYPPQAAP